MPVSRSFFPSRRGWKAGTQTATIVRLASILFARDVRISVLNQGKWEPGDLRCPVQQVTEIYCTEMDPLAKYKAGRKRYLQIGSAPPRRPSLTVRTTPAATGLEVISETDAFKRDKN